MSEMKPSGDANTNPALSLAWEFVVNTGISVFLTGKAGTGKTTFLRRLREESPKRMVVLAPTGVAAVNAGGQTIHSFFQLDFGVHIPGQVTRNSRKHFQMSQTKKHLIRTLDLLVIDEISMVRADVLDKVDSVLRQYRDPSRPFGGVQLLLIGDLMQLPPVARDDEWRILKDYYKTEYFFSSLALLQLEYVTIELRKIYRQSDQRFIEMLGKVRQGILDKPTIEAFNSRVISEDQLPKEGWIKLTTHNEQARRHNESRLQELTTPPFTYTAAIHGDFPESNYPTDPRLVLKEGAQVMFVKNDLDEHRYYNGKIGKVTSCDAEKIEVTCPDSPEPITVRREVWENSKYTIDPKSKAVTQDVSGTFSQYPLRLAWAITVHKSQGLTFDHAILDINSSFAHGQTYVALSRCRSLEGLALSAPIRQRSVITDSQVDSFISHGNEMAAKAARELELHKRRFTLSLLDDLYDYSWLEGDTKWLDRVVKEHNLKGADRLAQLLSDALGSFRKDVVDVAEKFRQAYHTAVLQMPESKTFPDEAYNERFHKSAVYFLDKLQVLYQPIMAEAQRVFTDNRQTAEVYHNAVAQLRDKLLCKAHILAWLQTDEFTPLRFLAVRAQAFLRAGSGTLPASKKRRRKILDCEDGPAQPIRQKPMPAKLQTKTPKEPKPAKEPKVKGATVNVTNSLLNEGLSPEQVAERRSLAVSTIYSHLGQLVKRGDQKLDKYVSPAIQQIVKAVVVTMSPGYTTKDVFDALNGHVPMYVVRLVLDSQ